MYKFVWLGIPSVCILKIFRKEACCYGGGRQMILLVYGHVAVRNLRKKLKTLVVI